MRIAQLVSARVVNGAARHCLALSAALAERGHQILLVHRPGLDVGALPSGVEGLETDFSRRPRELSRVANRLAEFGADVLHTHMSSAHSLGAVIRVWRGAPLVATAHNRHFQLHWVFNDRVIAPSRSTAAYHRRVNLPLGGAVEVIPNFVDGSAIRPAGKTARAEARRRLGLHPAALVIGSVADITANKRPSDLVKAVRPLLESRPEAILVLVGGVQDADEAERVRLAAGSFENRVRLLGRRDDAPRLLAAFDIFALVSRSEEAPMAVLEAMAAGLPVVGTDVGGIGELVIAEETGLLAPPRDVEAIAERLARLAGNAELRRRLGEAGRGRALAEFGKGPIVRRVEAVLEAAAQSRPGWAGRSRGPAPLAHA
jgi:glycosyltransferase involved in cell wall biosynthesis